MKKVFKLFIICFVFTTLFFAKGNTVSAASIREGDITWEIKNQVLYIKPVSGTKGVMKDYKLKSKKPWSGNDFNTIRI